MLPLTTLLVVLVASPALADGDAAADLGISPLGYEGAWFDLELEPGEAIDLEIELANHGDGTAEARSYVADVYSLINGGMGVALHDELADNTVTNWIDYPSITPALGPDSAMRQAVLGAVPEDAQPGQYIAALAVEHQADRADDANELGIDQVVRQAIAVNITVPGPVTAELALGDTDHLLTAGRSTMRTELDNSGNWHLVPSGELELTGPNGRTVTEQDLDLAIVYAGTSTHVETVLDHELEPGTYTVTTTLGDANHDVEATHTSTFEVEAPPRRSAVPGVDRVIETFEAAGPGLLAAALIALGLALAALLILLVRRRRSRPEAEQAAPPSPRNIAPQPPVKPPAPAAVPLPPAPSPGPATALLPRAPLAPPAAPLAPATSLASAATAQPSAPPKPPAATLHPPSPSLARLPDEAQRTPLPRTRVRTPVGGSAPAAPPARRTTSAPRPTPRAPKPDTAGIGSPLFTARDGRTARRRR